MDNTVGDAFAAGQELFCMLAQIGLIALKLYQLSVTFVDQGEIGRYGMLPHSVWWHQGWLHKPLGHPRPL